MLNLSLTDYNDITLAEFFNKFNGFFKFNLQKEKEEWKRFQYIAYSIMMNNPNIKKSDKPSSFENFLNGTTKKPIHFKSKEQFEKFAGIK